MPSDAQLIAWAEENKIHIGPTVPNAEEKMKVLQLLWTWRDLGTARLEDIEATNLFQYRVQLKEGTTPYSSKQRRFANDKEWWFRKIVQEGIDAGMYERTVTANGKISEWNAAPVMVPKPGQVQPRLAFNYHHVWENIPGSHMELASKVHSFLSDPRHGSYCYVDFKHAYWVIPVHPDDCHYLAFNVPGLGQFQPTRLPQGSRTSSFSFQELMLIAFGSIPEPNPEPFLLQAESPEALVEMAFYIDDLFAAGTDYYTQFKFLKEKLFPRLAWAKLKLTWYKCKFFTDTVHALGEDHEVGGRTTIKPARADRILNWPTPMDQTGVRSFLGAVQPTRRWVKSFAEVARPLTRLTGKVEWQWTASKNLAFEILRKQCATKAAMFGWDPQMAVHLYSDASTYAAGGFISQFQRNQQGSLEERPLYYDSFTFSQSERNYDTYRRELRAIVGFCMKYRHMLEVPETSIVHTDHKPLVGFLNSDTHEDIFARWATKLRSLNIKFEYILGERNIVADSLSRTIFMDVNCKADDLVQKISDAVDQNKKDTDWFWKSGKGGYQQMLKELTDEQKLKMISSMQGVTLHPVGWVSFLFLGELSSTWPER